MNLATKRYYLRLKVKEKCEQTLHLKNWGSGEWGKGRTDETQGENNVRVDNAGRTRAGLVTEIGSSGSGGGISLISFFFSFKRRTSIEMSC